MSDFLKYLGLSDEDAELAKRLASPADMAAQGASSLGESAGRALGGLGAKLDARLGTTARGQRPKEIDPLMPQETTPRANLGLFETLGTAVPNVVAATAGNALPVSGPAMPGAVAAFPTPKQSLRAMQEHAMVRDALESSAKQVEDYGFRALPESIEARLPEAAKLRATINKPTVFVKNADGSSSMDEAAWQEQMRARESIRRARDNDAMRQSDAAQANYEQRLDNGWEPGTRLDDFSDILGDADFAARSQSLGLGRPLRLDTPNPRAKIPAEQSELERYLSGLFGPRAK